MSRVADNHDWPEVHGALCNQQEPELITGSIKREFLVGEWPLDRTRKTRKISQKAIDKVAASIREYGWRQPIVATRGGWLPFSCGLRRRRSDEWMNRPDVSARFAAIESLILSGHPDLDGLCLALADWGAELRLIQRETNG